MRTFISKIYFYTIAIILLFASCKGKLDVDAIYHNANIYTVDYKMNKANAFAILDGKFIEVGSDDEVFSSCKSSNVIDLKEASVFPGLWDAHCHFYGYGLTQTQYANLVGTNSFADVLQQVKVYRNKYPNEKWILGRGWDQNDWDEKRFPNKDILDSLYPNTPVLLVRIDGHAVLVNSKALQIAGFGEDTKIKGGDLIKNSKKLTGVLLDNAADVLKGIVPKPSDIIIEKSLLKAQDDCFAVGLTSLTDAGLKNRVIHSIDELHQSGKLKMRINAMLSPSVKNFKEYVEQGIYKTDRLLINSMKLYADGALGSRGACLLEPYSDNDAIQGFLLKPHSYYDSICRILYKKGYQANTHAIGDSAVRMVLKTYANILKGKNDNRWRIEHAQTVNPDDFHYFGDYRIIPAINTTHATSDMYWAEERLGKKRIKTAYAYKMLLNENGWCTNGSDFPIESINPIYGFYAAIARQDKTGYPDGGFQMDNALTREEALRAMTIWAAKGCFAEKERGSIEPDKMADFVVLDRDIMVVDKSKIYNTEVIITVIAGELVFEK